MSAGNHNTTDQPTTISSTVDSSPVILPLSPQQTESTSQPQPQTHPSPSPLPNLPVLSLPLDTTVTQTSEDGRTHQQHQHNNKDKKREGYWCLCVPPKVKRKVVGNISCSMGPCSCYAQGSGFMGTSGCCCLWPIVAISGFSWVSRIRNSYNICLFILVSSSSSWFDFLRRTRRRKIIAGFLIQKENTNVDLS